MSAITRIIGGGIVIFLTSNFKTLKFQNSKHFEEIEKAYSFHVSSLVFIV